ncbi:hypothetical protein ES15_3412 [Cronobacter sakazakii ES15]|nr:hypothetical protein ES15_3412 [Cronobacter sakazakii ES15]
MLTPPGELMDIVKLPCGSMVNSISLKLIAWLGFWSMAIFLMVCKLTTSMVSVTTTAYAICAWLRSGKTTRTDARQGGIAGIRAVANGRLTYALMVYSVTLAYLLPKRRRVLPI